MMWKLELTGDQNILPQSMPLCHKDYFELIIWRHFQTQEKLEQHRPYQFLNRNLQSVVPSYPKDIGLQDTIQIDAGVYRCLHP